jgi:hypothetical protein
MCAAHTCIRSILSQAFRPSSRRIANAITVPDFLVPALARPASRPLRSSSRSFSSSKRPRTESQTWPHPGLDAAIDADATYAYPPKGAKESFPLRIPLPERSARFSISAWVGAIDPFLPRHLRKNQSSGVDTVQSAEAIDFAWVLKVSQGCSLDILGHIGLVEGRWDAAVWITKKLVEEGARVQKEPLQLPLVDSAGPGTESRSLQDLTNDPLVLPRSRPSGRLQYSLDDLTAAPDSINWKHVVLKRALGQVWMTLGNLIIIAAGQGKEQNSTVMSYVLEIIAYLHHMGLIPDTVYTQKPYKDSFALQQPPTLHLLSSTILTALSDATWRAHEASVKVAKERMNAQYLLGHEIPGSRIKIEVPGTKPELWLELVLWSCLHGGWVLDGAAILHCVYNLKGDPWHLQCWKDVYSALENNTSASSPTWWIFSNKTEEATSTGKARARTPRTISSEVVTAFIDGLVNSMRTGVGARGTPPQDLVDIIKNLKCFLDKNALSLGWASWDSIIARLLDSGGMVPEKRPELLLSTLGLASNFGSEVASTNASPLEPGTDTEPPYFFEPSTTPLGLLHRTMRSFLEIGDIPGATETLNEIQRYTDSNKQASLQQFFEALKNVPLNQNEPFTSRLPPIEFPAFDPQLPAPLLAKLLNVVTDAKLYDLGRQFLLSEELDGPLITSDMYAHPEMAAAVVRFGTLAGENDLVLKVIKKTSFWDSEKQTHRMPASSLVALMSSQVQLHRWDSVRGMQNYVVENPGYRLQPKILATFAAELLRTAQEDDESGAQLSSARSAFADLLFAWEDIILTQLQNQLYCILAILSTVRNDWKEFCSQFLAISTRQKIKLSTDDFNQVLSGVVDGYGSLKGKEIVDLWCYKPPRTFAPYRAPGGLSTMPRFRAGKSEEYADRPDNIEIDQDVGAKLVLQGRVSPNRQTIWAILRRVQHEEDQRRESGIELTSEERAEVRQTLKWAARLLYYMGCDYEDIIRDLGGLAELAELEAPPSPKIVGLPDDSE